MIFISLILYYIINFFKKTILCYHKFATLRLKKKKKVNNITWC